MRSQRTQTTLSPSRTVRKIPLDLSAVGRSELRESVRTAVAELGYYFTERGCFWSQAVGHSAARLLRPNTLVVADLSRIAKRFTAGSPREWTMTVRAVRPYFLAFVRTRRDERYAWLVDDLVRFSDLRITVCRPGNSLTRTRACLAEALAHLEPDALLSLRVSRDGDRLWLEFVDGLTASVSWERLGIAGPVMARLLLKSAVLGSHGHTVEFLTEAGDLFEIDATAIRAIVDPELATRLEQTAGGSDATVGERVRSARRRADLTQAALAERTGLDQAVLSKLECGRHRPRFDTLARVAAGLGLSVAELLAG